MDPDVEIERLHRLLRQSRRELELARGERDSRAAARGDDATAGSLTLLESLILTLDARDNYTAGHSLAVAVYSRDLGLRVGLAEADAARLYLAGLVHDIGKVAVTDAVLRNPGRLTEREFAEIQRHPVVGAAILEPARAFADLLPAVRHHHERMDGRGYPDGLAGQAIPISARIVAIADAYNSMTSDRSYRKAMPVDRALSIMRENAGSQHDPWLFGIFSEMIMERDDDYGLARGAQFRGSPQLEEALAGRGAAAENSLHMPSLMLGASESVAAFQLSSGDSIPVLYVHAGSSDSRRAQTVLTAAGFVHRLIVVGPEGIPDLDTDSGDLSVLTVDGEAFVGDEILTFAASAWERLRQRRDAATPVTDEIGQVA